MPDILDPANPSRGDRPLTGATARERNGEGQTGSKMEDRGLRIEDRCDQSSILDARSSKAPSPASPLAPSRQPAPPLHFQHVSKWYGPVIGVNQVTLELRPGITGLVGSNGAGKSTLMKLATGQLRPDIGSVSHLSHEALSPASQIHVRLC